MNDADLGTVADWFKIHPTLVGDWLTISNDVGVSHDDARRLLAQLADEGRIMQRGRNYRRLLRGEEPAPYVTIRDALYLVDYTGITLEAIRGAIDQGRLPFVRRYGRRVVKRVDVLEMYGRGFLKRGPKPRDQSE